MEDPPEPAGQRAGELLDGDLRDQVEVDLGTPLGDLLAELQHPLIGGQRLHCEQIDVLDEPGHIGQTVRRGDGEARPDNARLDLGVEQHGDQGVLEAGDDDQLVGEGILGSAQPAHLLAQGVRLRRGDVIDHQDLERRPSGRARPGRTADG